MEKVKSLPFATYDLAVYLPGGAVLLVILANFLNAFFPHTKFPINFDFAGADVSIFVKVAVLIAGSYLVGHVGAFVSSYLIEKPVHYVLGFPSQNWVNLENFIEANPTNLDPANAVFRAQLKKAPLNRVTWVLYLAQLPAIIWIILGYVVKPFGFYTPKLPRGLLSAVTKNFDELATGVSISDNSRWEKVVEHVVANSCPSAYERMYNYLVIYGALRLLALIALTLCWWDILYNASLVLHFGLHFDFLNFLQFMFISLAYTLTVMAFAKFNRRYFEECVLGFLFSEEKSPRVATRRPRVSAP